MVSVPLEGILSGLDPVAPWINLVTFMETACEDRQQSPCPPSVVSGKTESWVTAWCFYAAWPCPQCPLVHSILWCECRLHRGPLSSFLGAEEESKWAGICKIGFLHTQIFFFCMKMFLRSIERNTWSVSVPVEGTVFQYYVHSKLRGNFHDACLLVHI